MPFLDEKSYGRKIVGRTKEEKKKNRKMKVKKCRSKKKRRERKIKNKSAAGHWEASSTPEPGQSRRSNERCIRSLPAFVYIYSTQSYTVDVYAV